MIPGHSQALPKRQSSTVRDIKEDKPKPFGLWPKQVRKPLTGKQARSFSYQALTLQVTSQLEPVVPTRWKGTSSGLWPEVAPLSTCLHPAPRPVTQAPVQRWFPAADTAAAPPHPPLPGAFTTLLCFTQISRLCLRFLELGKKGKKQMQ